MPQQRPTKTKIMFNFPSLNIFTTLTWTHTNILRSNHSFSQHVLGLCAANGWRWNHRGRERECAVLKSEEELTAMACGLYGVVWSWVCRRGTERCLPTSPNNNLDGLPAWCLHVKPDKLKILQGINNSQQHREGFSQQKQWARTEWCSTWHKPEHLSRPRPIYILPEHGDELVWCIDIFSDFFLKYNAYFTGVYSVL